jgi:hypothetical protein
MLKLTCMGTGYKLWAETAKDAIDNFNDISTILDKIDDVEHPERIKQNLNPNRNNKSLLLDKANDSFRSMTIVQMSDYPATMLSLKKFVCPAPVAPLVAICSSRNVMTLQLPGNKVQQRKVSSSSCTFMYEEIETSRPRQSRASPMPSHQEACRFL